MKRENPEQAGQPQVGRWSDVSGAGSDVTWGVGAVADRLGVAASTLRTWERRYGIGPSHRTGGGHRRYTERDINRVEVVRRLVARGVGAQDAARVAVELDHEDLAQALSDAHADGPGAEDIVDSVLAAVTASDEARLHEIVAELVEGAPALDVWREVLAPALTRMAHEATTGEIDTQRLVWASSIVQRHMSERLDELIQPDNARILLAAVGPTDSLVLAALALALAQAEAVQVQAIVDVVEVAELLGHDRTWSVLVVWDPADQAALPDDTNELEAIVRVRPGWPHDAWLRLGSEPDEVATDVGHAVAHILDRLP